jgi:protein ImuA
MSAAFPPLVGSRQEIIATLRERVRCLEGAGQAAAAGSFSGCGGLERLLPEGSFPRGKLVEWLAEGEGSGAGTLALLAAQAAAAGGGALVVLDRRRSFYPPAAAALGVKLEQVLVVRADSREDELWACDQALRCTGVAAVWGAIDRLQQRWFRRLQLAAESGGGVGHLLRPARVRSWPSWSYAQFLVESLPSRSERTTGERIPVEPAQAGRQWRVELARCQGLARGGAMEVELDDVTGVIRETVHETRPVHLVAQLAHPTPRRRSARA